MRFVNFQRPGEWVTTRRCYLDLIGDAIDVKSERYRSIFTFAAVRQHPTLHHKIEGSCEGPKWLFAVA